MESLLGGCKPRLGTMVSSLFQDKYYYVTNHKVMFASNVLWDLFLLMQYLLNIANARVLVKELRVKIFLLGDRKLLCPWLFLCSPMIFALNAFHF